MEARFASTDGFDEILASVSVRPGYLGRVGESQQFEGRYANQFFGLWRCAYVRWTTDGFAVSGGSGDECTTFRERPPSGRWRARRDSNPRPSAPEADALSTELRALA